MNIGECMEYAQKLCNATTAAERNSARAELRAAIAATVAAERERCAMLLALCLSEGLGGWSWSARTHARTVAR